MVAGEGRTALPVEAARADFEAALGRGRPVVVVAPTGSGKSTRLPEWMAEAVDGLVVVVEPRRVACRALASFVARRRGAALGGEVGHRVRFDDRSSPDTRILFVTPGVALNLLASDARIGALLVDEFHERSWEVDLVVALARSRRGQGDATPLVLCSATLDAAGLTETLDAELVQAEGRTYPVEVEYRGEGGPDADELEWRVRDAVCDLLDTTADGDVLVFLPGKGEIERARRALLEAGAQAELVPVHGGISPEQLAAAFEAAGVGTPRRVYLATNVAETSVTLPGVRVVVDSGLARQRVHQAGRSVLALTSISRASMDQRAGRAGRVAAGRCVRLWSRGHAPEEVTPPEIARVELDDLVLRAAGCGLEGSDLERAPWVTPPPGFALARARARLHEAGALDGEGRVTARGRIQARLPVSPEAGRLLASPPEALAGTLADLVALLEVGRDLLLPGHLAGGSAEELEARRAELFAAARDEVEVQLACLRAGDARRHGLHRARLEEARRLAASLRELVGAPRPPRPSSVAMPPALDDRAALLEHLLARWPEAAFVLRPRASRGAQGRGGGRRGGRERGGAERPQPWGNGVLELGVRPYTIPGRAEEEQPDAPVAGLVLAHEWLGVGRSARGVGRMLMTCGLAELARAGVGERQVGAYRLERTVEGPRILATVERVHAGARLGAEEEALEGASLRLAIASLTLEGRLWKGLLPELEQDLLTWSLLAQEAEAQGARLELAAPDSASAYLEARLEQLGVESCEDLALLEPGDLRPPLGSMATAAGMDPRAPELLAADFPVTWVHDDARYRVDVRLATRRVTLVPDNARARKAGEPPSSRLPRWRGFSVLFVQASRKLRLR